ncbi:MAG TPA: N-acetyltransferase, partial [Candidatus Udaeobacter sp.]|nr:N-acetyltransferase [Candidatus Udaeobacter sp.]
YDRLARASRLGFSRLTENSVDAVGDRDFALEYLNAAAVLGVHLSRLAEDLVLWCSPGFGWYLAPDGFSTGSSLLPQKRNPDLFELARAKAGRLMSNAQRLAIVLKGLPSAYQKDLQEDKEAIFDTADTLERLLAALTPAIHALTPIEARVSRSLTPDLLAVELADALVERGVPFRDAHAAVGRLWALAEKQGATPADLPLDQRLAISPHFDDPAFERLTIEAALERRSHAPGGGAGSVAAQIARMEARLGLGDGDPDGIEEGARSGGEEAGGETLETRGSQDGGSASRVARPRQEPRRSGSRHRPLPLPTEAEPASSPPGAESGRPSEADANGVRLRRATLRDVPGIARIMSEYVAQGVLLPRPVGELYQCIREFHVAEVVGSASGENGERESEIVACCALRLLWDDLGEVRSLAVRPDFHGSGLGARLVAAVVEDARALEVPRMIALTREVPFFERCGFTVISRDRLPRKVWADCVRCPRRHACDEVAVVLDLVPGATEAAEAAAGSWLLPIPQLARPDAPALPIIS